MEEEEEFWGDWNDWADLDEFWNDAPSADSGASEPQASTSPEDAGSPDPMAGRGFGASPDSSPSTPPAKQLPNPLADPTVDLPAEPQASGSIGEDFQETFDPREWDTQQQVVAALSLSTGGVAGLMYGLLGEFTLRTATRVVDTAADTVEDLYTGSALQTGVDTVTDSIGDTLDSIAGVSGLKQTVGIAGQSAQGFAPASKPQTAEPQAPEFDYEAFAREQAEQYVAPTQPTQPTQSFTNQPTQPTHSTQPTQPTQGNNDMAFSGSSFARGVGAAILGRAAQKGFSKLGLSGGGGSSSFGGGAGGGAGWSDQRQKSASGTYTNVGLKKSASAQSLSGRILGAGESAVASGLTGQARAQDRLLTNLGNQDPNQAAAMRNQLARQIDVRLGTQARQLGSTRNTVFQDAMVKSIADAEVAFNNYQNKAKQDTLNTLAKSQQATANLITSLKGGSQSSAESTSKKGLDIAGGLGSTSRF